MAPFKLPGKSSYFYLGFSTSPEYKRTKSDANEADCELAESAEIDGRLAMRPFFSVPFPAVKMASNWAHSMQLFIPVRFIPECSNIRPQQPTTPLYTTEGDSQPPTETAAIDDASSFRKATLMSY